MVTFSVSESSDCQNPSNKAPFRAFSTSLDHLAMFILTGDKSIKLDFIILWYIILIFMSHDQKYAMSSLSGATCSKFLSILRDNDHLFFNALVAKLHLEIKRFYTNHEILISYIPVYHVFKAVKIWESFLIFTNGLDVLSKLFNTANTNLSSNLYYHRNIKTVSSVFYS